MSVSRLGLFAAIAALTAVVSGCGRDKPEPAHTALRAGAKTGGAEAKATAAKASAPTGAAAAKAAAAGAAKAPEPAKPAKPAKPAEPAKPEPPKASVALHFGSPGDEAFALPTAGKPAIIRATPIDANGRPLQGLGTVAGSPLVLVAARSDLSWLEARAPAALSEPNDTTHTFKLTFTQGGPHVVLFAFRTAEGQLVQVPSFFTVKGERRPDAPAGGAQRTWRGPKGLVAELLGQTQLDVCKPTLIGARFKRRGKLLKPASVAWLSVGDGVRSLSELKPPSQVAAPKPPAKPAGEPAEKPAAKPSAKAGPKVGRKVGAALPHAVALAPTAVGSRVLLAVARIGKESVVARFAVVVGGQVPEGGCSPAP